MVLSPIWGWFYTHDHGTLDAGGCFGAFGHFSGAIIIHTASVHWSVGYATFRGGGGVYKSKGFLGIHQKDIG